MVTPPLRSNFSALCVPVNFRMIVSHQLDKTSKGILGSIRQHVLGLRKYPDCGEHLSEIFYAFCTGGALEDTKKCY